jgi:hypothetical protein
MFTQQFSPEVLASNSGQGTGYPDQGFFFCDFPQSICENVGLLLQL